MRFVTILTTLFLASLAGAEPMLEQTTVYQGGEEGYACYRIPSVIAAPSGHLLAFAEGRKDNCKDHGDVDLVMKRSTDGGKTWGALELVYEEGGTQKITIGNPCPVVDQSTGTIWLPFCRDNNDVFMTHSTDDGRTWESPVEITEDVKQPGWGWYATGPGIAIQLAQGPHAGRLVVPCNHGEKVDGKSMSASHCIYSDDHGKTWQLGGSAGPHTNESQIVEQTNGRLLLNMRKAKQHPNRGTRAVAYSDDQGVSWSAPQDAEALPGPTCQGSTIRHHFGDAQVLLFSNPASDSRRVDMTVRMSEDEGKTWPVARQLHKGGSAYSCLVSLPGGEAGCLYESSDTPKLKYGRIVFARFNEAWLRGE